jgi:flagellar M-ring protein FliF
MNDQVQAYLSRLRQWWTGQSSSRRLRLAVLVVLGLAVIIGGWAFITSPNWQPLYTNLNARTAGQITAQLNTMKVPYQLTSGGSTIEVPKKDVNQARVSLADQNVPSSTVGLPSSSLSFGIGESDAQIQATQLANLEATLQSTIDSITGVHSSRVLVNQPAPGLFGETTQQASASVFVDLVPGNNLSVGQVRGIMNLVAHSVQGLSVKNVSVVDQNGLMLSAGALEGSGQTVSGVSQGELAAENQVASQIRGNVENMLTQVLGAGNAVVQVNAVLNFNHSTVNSTQYGKGVLSQQQVQTSTSTGSTPPSTPAGTAGNTPGTTVTSSASGATSTQSSKTTVNKYDVNQTKTVQSIPAGQIQRLTVAVVVNQKLTPKEASSLKSLVANAAGVNFKAGDQLSVVGIPFNRTAVNAALASMQKAQQSQTIRQAAAALAGILVLVFLFIMIRRTIKNRPPHADAPAAITLPRAAGGQVDFQEPMSVADLLNEMRAAKEPAISDQARQRLDEMARNDPETAARLLKAWMEEESS